MAPKTMKWRDATAIFAGTLAVGCIDWITGIEIRVLPLYFLPLVLAAWSFGKTGAFIGSMFASAVWVVVHLFGGHEHHRFYIWGINFFTQGISFLVVSLLVGSLRESLLRERALSRTDSLTGLLNSRSFHEQGGVLLTLCHRNRRPAALAFIDLDNFKQVNDTLGHEQGDRLLCEVARVLTGSLRSSDLVARMGGDEFVVLLPETDGDSARSVLEKLREHLLRTPQFQSFPISASIGVVACARAPAILEDMIKTADAVMYEVKASGKNRVHIQDA